MRDRILLDGEQYVKKATFQRRWYRLMLVLSSMVVFVITYAMILPAITLEQAEETPDAPQVTEEILSEEASDHPETGKAMILDLGHIVKAGSSLKYKTPDAKDWIALNQSNAGSELPGNAYFQMNINFAGIDLNQLIQADGKIIYQLPEIFRNAKSGGDLAVGTEMIGKLEVDGSDVHLNFDVEWLKRQLNHNESQNKNQTLSGLFTVEAEVNLSKLPDGGEYTIEGLNQPMKFEKDLVARYGEITLEKSLGNHGNVIDEEGTKYLEYKLTVTAGKEGCPGVLVRDQFTVNEKYVESYEILSPQGALLDTDSENENIRIWNVGDMAPGEAKTLTYRVKLTGGYLAVARNNDPIQNEATLFSTGKEVDEQGKPKEYSRDSVSAVFTPVAKTGLSKKSAVFVPTEDGGGTITYTIWVSADKNNNYTLEDVIIWDSLDQKIPVSDQYPNSTEEAIRKYLSYDENSFQLYAGGQKDQNGAAGLTLAEKQGVLELNQSETGYERNFRYQVGSLAPGESKTLVYTIKVDKGIYTAGNDNIVINNRAMTLTESKNEEDILNERIWLEKYSTTTSIEGKKWAGKRWEGPTTEEITVSMGVGQSFKVPQGSYQYQVTVNEAGDWDVTLTTMKDRLSNSHMQYVGYLRIDAYGISSKESKTGWIKIDGETSFELPPEKLKAAGLPDSGEYAYLFTYYAKPSNMGGVSSIAVTNTFQLTGEVRKNGKKYSLGDNILSETTITIQGTNYFTADKQFWYDDESELDRSLYWILCFEGESIPKGTSLRDTVVNSGTNVGSHKIASVAKAFIGDRSMDFSDAKDPTKLTGVQPFENYRIVTKTDSNLTLTLTEEVALGEEKSLYFIIQTKPNADGLPNKKGTYKTYRNELSTQDPGSDFWVHQSEESYHLFKGGHIYKETVAVFTATPEQLKNEEVTTSYTTKSDLKLQYGLLRASGGGTYVAWNVILNKAGDLSGRYRVAEQIPEGMEVIYVQRYSYRGTEKTFIQQTDFITQGYTEVIKEYDREYDQNPAKAFFYVKDQEVIWDVAGLQSGSGEQHVTFLVVCRLTDPKVLLGGEEKDFVNDVSLQDTQGNTWGVDTAAVTLNAPGLVKSGEKYGEHSPIYRFELTLNPLGTDLIPEGNTIRLIDEMSDRLQLVDGSIEVVDEDKNPVGFTYAVENRKLILTLPDDLLLTVTYQATVNAAPGESVAFSNRAYWEGYPEGAVSKTEDEFSYVYGGEISVDDNPTVTITKKDRYDGNVVLEGAEFALYETELGENGLLTKGSPVYTGTTDPTGTVIFGTADVAEKKLKYNTVYRLVETKAPSGYVRDLEPHDFLIAKQENQEFPDYSQYGSQVTISYQGAQYAYTVWNHKGEIQVKKQFADAAGNLLENKLNGTYHFGLFEKGKTTDPIQTTAVKFENAVSSDVTAKFTNVELEKEYVVYELDDEGKPIMEGKEGIVSGIPFVVSYCNNNPITVTAENPVAEVIAINRMNYAQLPASGGYGTKIYTIGGALLTLGAAGLLCHKIKHKREKKDLLA